MALYRWRWCYTCVTCCNTKALITVSTIISSRCIKMQICCSLVACCQKRDNFYEMWKMHVCTRKILYLYIFKRYLVLEMCVYGISTITPNITFSQKISKAITLSIYKLWFLCTSSTKNNLATSFYCGNIRHLFSFSNIQIGRNFFGNGFIFSSFSFISTSVPITLP